MNIKIAQFISIFLVIAFFVAPSAAIARAAADSIVIQNDGEVVLIVGDDVLGTSIIAEAKPIPTPPPTKSQSSKPTPPAQTKTVPIVSSSTPSIIQANPSTNKKVQVQIKQSASNQTTPLTGATNTKPSSAVVSPSTAPATAVSSAQPSTAPGASATPTTNTPPQTPLTGLTTVANKDVDKVVLEGKTNQAVLSIKSSGDNQLTLQQDNAEVTTSLPLQINSQTRVINVVSANGATDRLNVLPKEAVQGSGISTPKVSLAEENGSIVYDIKGQKQGKLFGVFSVQSPVEVKLSAQTGQVISTSQSPLFSLFGLFIR